MDFFDLLVYANLLHTTAVIKWILLHHSGIGESHLSSCFVNWVLYLALSNSDSLSLLRISGCSPPNNVIKCLLLTPIADSQLTSYHIGLVCKHVSSHNACYSPCRQQCVCVCVKGEQWGAYGQTTSMLCRALTPLRPHSLSLTHTCSLINRHELIVCWLN